MIDQTLGASAEMPALLPEPSSLPVSSSVSSTGPINHFLEWFGDLGIFLLASDAGWADAAV